VLSAGALATPLILQRSGVGDSRRLESLAIETISDLPGVGQDYQDHQLIFNAVCRINAEVDDTADAIFRDEAGVLERLQNEFDQGKGMLASNFVDMGIKLRPTEMEVQSMGHEMEMLWNSYFRDKPDKPLAFIGILGG
jgi:alcohol oxidase